jgi:Right handed beta helix region
MKLMKSAVVLFFATVTFNSADVLAQANIADLQGTVGTVLTVDANTGADVNAGIGQPLKTLQAAVDKALINSSRGLATKVLIGPGEYRETLNIDETSSQLAPITFEALQTGTVTVSGSDILTHPFHASGNQAIFSYTWNYNFGLCPIPNGWPGSKIQPIVRHREMVFVNSVFLTQVLSASSMHAGTFFVDQPAHAIRIWPFAGTNMATAKVEAAVRTTTLNVSGHTNLVFKGIVFQHASSCINQDGASVSSSSNVLFDSVLVQWNNWGGLGINFTSGITVRNSIASHNGGNGFGGYRDRNALYQNNEASYNNWRGGMGGFYDWGMGGLKLLGLHTGTVSGFRAVGNQSQGLWFDTDNKNITITGAHLIGNKVANLQLEANPGPISVSNSSLCSGDLGMNIIDTEHLTMTSNTFYGNGGNSGKGAEFFLAGNPGGRQIIDWETHQGYFLHTQDMTLKNNVFQDNGSGQNLFRTYLSSGDFSHFTANFTGSGNHWYDPTSTNKFVLSGGHVTNLKGWQSAVRDDYSSTWGSSSSAAAACH